MTNCIRRGRSLALTMSIALGLGCGVESDEQIDQSETGNEIGQLEQRLSYWDGYGVMSDQNRCWTNNHQFDWVNGSPGDCYFPAALKKVFINNRAAQTCTGTNAADYASAFASAKSYWEGELGNAGWGVLSSAPSCTGASCQGHTITLECGSPFAGSPASAKGGTEISQSFLDCSSTPDGDRCIYGDSVSRAFKARIDTFTNGVVSSQRRKFIQAVTRHEIGHSVGLGHEDGTPNGEANCLAAGLPVAGGSQVMDMAGCQSGLTQQQWYAPTLTSFERTMLHDYQ